MASERLEQKLRRFVDLRQERDIAKRRHDEAKSAYEQEQAALYDEIEQEVGDLSSVTLDLGEGYGKINFQRRHRTYGRIFNADAAYEALDKEALTDELTKPGFDKAAVTDLVNERLQNHQELPDGIDWYTKAWINIARKGS